MWNVFSANVILVDEDWAMAPPGIWPVHSLFNSSANSQHLEHVVNSFLTDLILQIFPSKHFHVASGPKFGSDNWMGYMMLPLWFDNPDTHPKLQYIGQITRASGSTISSLWMISNPAPYRRKL
jgi:hypothetical protein